MDPSPHSRALNTFKRGIEGNWVLNLQPKRKTLKQGTPQQFNLLREGMNSKKKRLFLPIVGSWSSGKRWLMNCMVMAGDKNQETQSHKVSVKHLLLRHSVYDPPENVSSLTGKKI